MSTYMKRYDGSKGQLSAQFGCLRNCAQIDGIGGKKRSNKHGFRFEVCQVIKNKIKIKIKNKRNEEEESCKVSVA